MMTLSPTARTGAAYTSLRQAWLPLTALALAFLVEMADNTVLMIALPTIGRDLGASTTALQWVTGAYSLTFGGLLLTAGSVADRFGRRRVLLWGLVAFGGISALTALVQAPGQLIAIRALLGVAAAAMAPITNSLVFRLFDDETLRMRAITVLVVVGMSGFALGPVLAGGALAAVSWHWLLLVNIPIAAVAWVGVRLGVAADTADELHPATLDLPGAALTVATLGLAAYALTSGVDAGWTAAPTLACAAGAVLAGALFVVRERRAASPMLDLRLLGSPTVRGSALALAGASVAMTGTMFILTLHYQDAYGWSPLLAGLANLPFVVTMLAATPAAEWLVARVGHRWATLIAALALTAGMLGLTWGVSHGFVAITVGVVVLTLGLRVVLTVCPIALMGAVPENRTAVGAALGDTAQEVGTSVGVALAGSVIAATLGATVSGAWSPEVIASFIGAEQAAFVVLGILGGAVAVYGATTLTDARTTEGH